MTTSQIVTFAILEAVALIVIVRVWLRPQRMSVVTRLFWSVVLVVPLFGIIIYGLVRTDPDEHPYDTDTTSGAAESEASGGGHGHD